MGLPQRTRRAGRRKGNCKLHDHPAGGARKCKLSISEPLVCNLQSWLCALCVLCGYFLISSCASAAPQEVVPVDGAAFQGELVSIDASGQLSFRIAGKKDQPSEIRTLASEALARWGHPVAPKPQPMVLLADGGRLVTAADWAGGASVRMAGNNLLLLSDSWGESQVPRALVRGIVFAQQHRADERERLVERLMGAQPAAKPADADVVWLTNGDRLTGKLAELERGSLVFETAGASANVPLSRVEAIGLANRRARDAIESSTAPSPKGKGILAVSVQDGSLLYAKSVRADEKEVTIELANGVKLKGGAMEDLAGLQSLGGPFVYLSDIDAADYRHVPYLSIAWPYTRDRNVLGDPIAVRGKRYLKGIGMHSAARLTYRLDPDFRRFDSTVAIDDSSTGRGSVTFGVYLLRGGQWAEAYKSDTIRGSDPPAPLSVDLKGAKGVTLTVDYADRGDELDHAVWLDARLVR